MHKLVARHISNYHPAVELLTDESLQICVGLLHGILAPHAAQVYLLFEFSAFLFFYLSLTQKLIDAGLSLQLTLLLTEGEGSVHKIFPVGMHALIGPLEAMVNIIPGVRFFQILQKDIDQPDSALLEILGVYHVVHELGHVGPQAIEQSDPNDVQLKQLDDFALHVLTAGIHRQVDRVRGGHGGFSKANYCVRRENRLLGIQQGEAYTSFSQAGFGVPRSHLLGGVMRVLEKLEGDVGGFYSRKYFLEELDMILGALENEDLAVSVHRTIMYVGIAMGIKRDKERDKGRMKSPF